MALTAMQHPMYFGATPDIFENARALRKTPTEAESILWSRLNKRQLLNLSFRRQHPAYRFIIDFYCPRLKLAIEADGSIHEIFRNKIYDMRRTAVLNWFGITVIRFPNDLIKERADDVILSIKSTAKSLMPGVQNNGG